MTNEELTVIEARAKAATPGEWEWEPTRRGIEWEDESGLPFFPQGTMLGETLIQLADTYEGYRADCVFIAHARTDIPALCAEVRRLQAAIKEVMEFNPLRNDRDAYLLATCEWGLKGKWGVDEEFAERPQRATFGLD